MKRADVYFLLQRLVKAALIAWGVVGLIWGQGALFLFAFLGVVALMLADHLFVRLWLYPRTPRTQKSPEQR